MHWADETLAETGHDALSPYVETFWLPILGPTATWLLRRIELRRRGGASVFNLNNLARELGVGTYTGWEGAMSKGFRRLMHFAIVAPIDGALAVHTHVPHLAGRQIARLPESLKKAHPPLARVKTRSA